MKEVGDLGKWRFYYRSRGSRARKGSRGGNEGFGGNSGFAGAKGAGPGNVDAREMKEMEDLRGMEDGGFPGAEGGGGAVGPETHTSGK